jgi:hypothetical protein
MSDERIPTDWCDRPEPFQSHSIGSKRANVKIGCKRGDKVMSGRGGDLEHFDQRIVRDPQILRRTGLQGKKGHPAYCAC